MQRRLQTTRGLHCTHGLLRYLGLDVLARCRINLITDTDPEIGGANLPALTA